MAHTLLPLEQQGWSIDKTGWMDGRVCYTLNSGTRAARRQFTVKVMDAAVHRGSTQPFEAPTVRLRSMRRRICRVNINA